MFVTLVALLLILTLLLALLKVTGVIGWGWLMIFKIVGYPSAFLASLAILVLFAVFFVRGVRYVLELREKWVNRDK